MPEYWDGEIPWATPKDLSDLQDVTISKTPRMITEAGLRSCGAKILPASSVLFSSRAPIGHVAINSVPMATNQGFKSLVPRKDVLDARYLYHWLRHSRSYLESLGNGATFKEVSKAVVARVEIPLPPMQEQLRLARILDQAQALERQRRRTSRLLDNLADSIKHSIFSQEPWRSRPLEDWLDPARPLTYGILMPGPDVAEGVPYVRVADIQDGQIVRATVRHTTAQIAHQYRRSTLEPGDLLISIRGHVGRLAPVPASLAGANITQDSARLAVTRGIPGYVRAALESAELQAWMARRTKGAAVRGINLGDLRSAPIPDAPEAVQRRLALELQEVELQKRLGIEHLQELDGLSRSLQARAFSGRL